MGGSDGMRAPLALLDEKTRAYLRSRRAPAAVVASLLVLLLYQQLFGPRELFIALLVAGTLEVVLRAPRWTIHGTVAAILLVHVATFTQVVSKQPHDAQSTRDDAVEQTARAFLRGENPWNHVPELPANASTGPTSILIALPVVALSDEINGLSLAFWVAFFALIAAGDLRRRNDSFPLLALLFVTGAYTVGYTLHWSLEELYYPYVWLPFAAWALARERWVLAGALIGATLMFRVSYVYVVAGLLLWRALGQGFPPAGAARTAASAALCAALLLAPFVWVGGEEFWSHNPFGLALYHNANPDAAAGASAFFRVQAALRDALGPVATSILRPVLALALLAALALPLRRFAHPFWHMTAGAFLGHTVAWIPAFPNDYALMLVCPAFLAIAFSARPAGAAREAH